MLHFHFESDPGTYGVEGGKQKSWKPEILEKTKSGDIGKSLMGRLSTSSRYVIDIIGTDPFSLGELGVVNLEKFEKLRYF